MGTSNTSLPLSVVTEIFWDTIAQSPRPQNSVQSPRPPLLKRSSSGQWGSTHSLRTVDIVDIINDVPNSPVHTAVDSEFEKQSPKPCHAIVHTTVGSEFEKQSTKPCDEISKPSTKKVCAAILKQSTKQHEKPPTKPSNKRKRKLKCLPSMMKKIASKRNKKRKSRGRSNKWSKDEDQRLRDAVNKFGKKKWNAVAAVLGRGRRINAVSVGARVCDRNWQMSTRAHGRTEDLKLPNSSALLERGEHGGRLQKTWGIRGLLSSVERGGLISWILNSESNGVMTKIRN